MLTLGNTGEKITTWSFGIFITLLTYGSELAQCFTNTNQITVAYKSSNKLVYRVKRFYIRKQVYPLIPMTMIFNICFYRF